MINTYGLTYSEIDTVNTMNPEIAAHNIATTYLNTTSTSEKLHSGGDVVLSDVLSLSNQYVDAYNYAYNYVIFRNKIIEEAE